MFFEQGHRKDMELLKREYEQQIAGLEAQVKWVYIDDSLNILSKLSNYFFVKIY